MRGQRERDGGEVHDSLDARGHEPVGCFLGPRGGYHDHAEADALGFHDVRQFVDMLDAQPLDRLADLRRIRIEGRFDREVLPVEAAVAEQRLAEIADAHHDHGPRMIRAQDVAHRMNQFFAAIAHAGIAELPEKPEVLADLGVAEAEQCAQLARRDRLLAGGLEPLQFA